MTVYTETFEAPAEGATLTNANTFYDVVVGSWEADNARAMHGSQSAKCNRVTATSSTCQHYGFTGTTGFAAKAYFYFTSAVAFTDVLFKVFASANKIIDVQLLSGNTVRLIDDGGSSIWDSTSTFPINQWVRLELYLTVHASTADIDCAFYVGDSSTPVDSFSTSTGNTGSANITQLQVGLGSSAYAADYWVDTIVLDDAASGFIGPEAVDTATYDLTITHDTDSAAVADRTYEIDATASVGTVTLTQTSGTTVSDTESPTGVFTFADPGGTDDLVFDLDAGTDTIEITITRSATPAILTFTGGTVTDIANWG